MVLLIQMSREMWQFDNDGEMHFEKVRRGVGAGIQRGQQRGQQRAL
jgi:hypothetical protein